MSRLGWRRGVQEGWHVVLPRFIARFESEGTTRDGTALPPRDRARYHDASVNNLARYGREVE